jgi:hypothetical protein
MKVNTATKKVVKSIEITESELKLIHAIVGATPFSVTYDDIEKNFTRVGLNTREEFCKALHSLFDKLDKTVDTVNAI